MKQADLPFNFLNDLDLRWVGDGRWQLLSLFEVITETVGMVLVPAGFMTDGPSIPKIPILYEKFRDRAWPAAIVHDWLYSKDCPLTWITRKQADDTFEELMDALLPKWYSKLYNDVEWAGVRLGGWTRWRTKSGLQEVPLGQLN